MSVGLDSIELSLLEPLLFVPAAHPLHRLWVVGHRLSRDYHSAFVILLPFQPSLGPLYLHHRSLGEARRARREDCLIQEQVSSLVSLEIPLVGLALQIFAQLL